MSALSLEDRVAELERRFDEEAAGEYATPHFVNVNPDGSINFVFPSNIAAAGLDLNESDNSFANPPRIRWLDAGVVEREHLFGIRNGANHQLYAGLGAPGGSDVLLLSDDGRSQLATFQNVAVAEAKATGTITLAVADQNVPGCSIAFTTKGGHALVLAWASFDFDVILNAVGVGFFAVDAITQATPAAVLSAPASAPAKARATVSTNFVFFPAPGNHTIGLVASAVNASGSDRCFVDNTTLTVLILDFA